MATVTEQPGFKVLAGAVESYRVEIERGPWTLDDATRRKLEQALNLGVIVHDMARRIADEWADAVRAGRHAFRVEDAKTISQIRSTWIQICDQMLKTIAEFESASYSVAGADAFRQSARECRLNHVDVDNAMVAIANLEQGRGVLLSEAMRELRDRAGR